MRNVIAIVLVASTLASGFVLDDLPAESSIREKRQAYGRKPPTTLPPLDGFTAQGVPVVKTSYAQSQHVKTSYDGTKELDHYRDFVDDPYKKPENLEQILRSKQRPANMVRSGRTSSHDAIRHPSRNSMQGDEGWGRVPDPWNRRQPIPAALSHQTRSNYQYGYEGGDAYWEVASRGDDHVTYRRRNPYEPYDRVVEAPAQGEGKVLARVVDLNTGNEQYIHDNSRRRDWSSSRQSRPRHYNPSTQRPEVRALDHHAPANPVRQGDWIQTSVGDNHVTWTRVGHAYPHRQQRYRQQPETRALEPRTTRPPPPPTTTAAPQYLHRQGDWVQVSKSDNHVTWQRVNTVDDHYRQRQTYYPTTTVGPITVRRNHYTDHQASLTRDNWTARPTHRVTIDHYYPIMNDQATADKAKRAGPNVMIN